MTDELLVARKKTLEELKSAALGELERRGYKVRGKTPNQIRPDLNSKTDFVLASV
jgi:hypothetical protein